MKIAILGWGSLIWDPRKLQLATEWMEGGPILSIEFSRISENGRLTLVIDEKHGADVPTRYALSSLGDVDEAVTDLQKREGTPNRDRIGFVDIASGRTSERAWTKHPVTCERIRAWAGERKLDSAVWTALEPNFEEKAGKPFSADAVVRYLSHLAEERKALAFAYIQNAPAEITTPARKRVEAKFGLLRAIPESTFTALDR